MAPPAVTMAAATDPEIAPAPVDEPSERVLKYDLSGPRLGATIAPDGSTISQFGWHFESQAAPGKHGPWFIVEKVFLIGGVDRNAFIPNGTLIFGMRLPNSFEFGVGPSLTLGGSRGANSGVVVAAGQSFRFGGIRVPVNLAVASERGGELRWTILTGWAIRDLVGLSAAPERPEWPNGSLRQGSD
jgi:hypothetical protein